MAIPARGATGQGELESSELVGCVWGLGVILSKADVARELLRTGAYNLVFASAKQALNAVTVSAARSAAGCEH